MPKPGSKRRHNALQFSSVAQSCPTLCNPMNRSTPGLSVHHQLPEFTQTHVHQVSDAIHPSHPLSSTSPPALNLSQHQGLFQWVSSSHQVDKVLEFQLQHMSFQWTLRTDWRIKATPFCKVPGKEPLEIPWPHPTTCEPIRILGQPGKFESSPGKENQSELNT